MYTIVEFNSISYHSIFTGEKSDEFNFTLHGPTRLDYNNELIYVHAKLINIFVCRGGAVDIELFKVYAHGYGSEN